MRRQILITTGFSTRTPPTSGNRQHHDLGPDIVPGEAIFVPAEGARREDDGSDLLVLDACDVTGPPVAAVHLPRRVPGGFHGSWIPDHAGESSNASATDRTDEKGLRA